jgi:mycothiol synthase
MQLTTRSYAGGADQESVIDLLRTCRTASGVQSWPDVALLRVALLGSPLLDPGRDARLWQDADGQVCGFAMLWLPWNYLVLFAHPAAHEGKIEAQIIEWGLGRAREIAQERGERIYLRVRPREGENGLINLLECHGFLREDWHSLRLIRTLDEPIPEPRLPAGFAIRPVAGEQEVEAYVALQREAFGTSHLTVDGRLARMGDPGYIRDLDLVATAPDGTLAAFVLGRIEAEEDGPGAPTRGSTDPIGTRPAYRRMGLARALLLEGFRRLQTHGVETVAVDTGGSNTATQALLASVGFRLDHRVLAYSREV